MNSHTYQARLCAGLEAMGFKPASQRSGKYKAYTKDDNRKQKYYFVGAAGALRTGDCATRSFSVGDPTRQTPVYQYFLNAGDKHLSATQPTSVQDRLSTLD